VDYYVPQPAIVKSGKLAPYQDLVYFVEPSIELNKHLAKIEENLFNFIDENNEKICEVIYKYVEINFEKLQSKNYEILLCYLRYLQNYSEKNIEKFLFTQEI
jgi:hypothetical protein